MPGASTSCSGGMTLSSRKAGKMPWIRYGGGFIGTTGTTLGRQLSPRVAVFEGECVCQGGGHGQQLA